MHENLEQLLEKLINVDANWSRDVGFIGGYAFLPKSINSKNWDNPMDGHFRLLNPMDEWERKYNLLKKKAEATLRLIIKPTVEFQIISALWIVKVGHLFDATIDTKNSYGNRLRRTRSESLGFGGGKSVINVSSIGLFAPYFTAYREWRENGLSSIEESLNNDKNILAITMDIEQFYHRVNPAFILKSSFLKAIKLNLTAQESFFTRLLLEAIGTWYASTPDYASRPEGAIPVGLSASKIIANVLLSRFDEAMLEKIEPIYYGRYVDDVFLVFENKEGLKDSESVINFLYKMLSPLLKIVKNENELSSLKLNLPFSRDSNLIFSGRKQKIFSLSSRHGLDLIHHIRQQIRIQSSEYRMLPDIPRSGEEISNAE